MTIDDPWFAVKDEVCSALNRTRDLYERWQDLQTIEAGGGDGSGNSSDPESSTLAEGLPPLENHQELEYAVNELRNALRSLEWDLEDLDDTICIVERNPKKFKVDNRELTLRRHFIKQTRDEVQIMLDKMNMTKVRDRDATARQAMSDSPTKSPTPVATHGMAKYSKLENDTDSPHRQFTANGICNENYMMPPRESRELENLSDNGDTLKTVSHQIHSEFDERQFFLDDFDNEMEVITDTKYDSTMNKMAKVFHLSNGNYNHYAPAPTAPPPITDFAPKSSSLCSLSTTITKCFLCFKD